MWLLISGIRFSSKCWCGQFFFFFSQKRKTQPLLIKQQKKSANLLETLVQFLPLCLSHHCMSFPIFCVSKARRKNAAHPHCRPHPPVSSHERRGCHSRELGLLGEQHRIPVSVQNHFISSIAEALSAGMKLVARKFPYYYKKEEMRSYREGQSLFVPLTLLCISVKHKYIFTTHLKPASELEHVEVHACFLLWHLCLN